MQATTEYQIIFSQSGAAHKINPSPTYVNGLRGFPGRTQTLCEMHLRPEAAAPPNGKDCAFCAEQARLIEIRRRQKGGL